MKKLRIPIFAFLVSLISIFSCTKNDQEGYSRLELEEQISHNLLEVRSVIKFNKLDSKNFEKIKSGESLDLILLIESASNHKNSQKLLLYQQNLASQYINRFGIQSYQEMMLKQYILLNPELKEYREHANSSKRVGTPCYDQFERDFNLLTIAAATCMVGASGTLLGPLVCTAGYGASVYYILEEFHDCCGC